MSSTLRKGEGPIMFRPMIRSVALGLVVAGCQVGQAFADDAVATAPAKQTTVAKSQVAATPAASRTMRHPAHRGRMNYRYSSNNNKSRTGRRWSYNYSGVGFPRMEGGLTAAANRTTWGRNP